MAALERAKSIPELAAATSAANTDLLIIVTGANTSTPVTKKIELQSITGNASFLSSNNIVFKNKSTPANSTITVAQGTMFFDDSYLYIAVANNVLKRVTLSSF